MGYAELQRHEHEYFTALAQARGLDPLGLGGNEAMTALRHGRQLDTEPLLDVATRAETLYGTAAPAERIALRRDVDKLVGHYAYHDTPVPTELSQVFTNTSAPAPYPRANLYEYAFGSNPENDAHLYTGDDREQALMRIITESVRLAHKATHLLILARTNLRHHHDSYGALAAATEIIVEMAKPMARTYRAVTPQFFRLAMTRRWRHVNIAGVWIQGPNVSHTAHLLVDRLAAGSYTSLTATNPAMAHVYQERQSTMPAFLRALLQHINTHEHPASILELSRTREDIEASRLLLDSLRKTKHMHKSYADKGLAAAGKTLSADMPDLLTANIELVTEPLRHGTSE